MLSEAIRPKANEPILAVNGLTKVFETRESVLALNDINLELHPNEFVSIVGPSGCGKSTLLYILGGLVKPNGGELRFKGQPVVGPGPERGMVFQEFALFPWLTVAENIAFGLDMESSKKRSAPAASQSRVKELISLMALQGFERHKPHELSGGMKQRVAIAACLAPDPEVLLMDEPFGALDYQTRSVLQRELIRIHEQTHKTIVFVTHDIPEAVMLSDRIVVLSRRPGTVKAIVDVPLPRPRHGSNPELSPEYFDLIRTLNGLIE